LSTGFAFIKNKFTTEFTTLLKPNSSNPRFYPENSHLGKRRDMAPRSRPGPVRLRQKRHSRAPI